VTDVTHCLLRRYRLPLWIAIACLSAGCSRAGDAPEGGGGPGASSGAAREAQFPDSLRQELVRMGREDQQIRQDLSPERLRDTAFAKSLLRGDSARTTRLRTILDAYGWPDSARAGDEAAGAAFLVLQHSPLHELQKTWLPAIERLARQGKVPPDQAALLVDRVLVDDSLPQRYGTQFRMVDGRLVLDPVEDEATLEERRSAMGLPTMDEYMRVMEEVYGVPVVRHR
jgi:hypothetical protein